MKKILSFLLTTIFITAILILSSKNKIFANNINEGNYNNYLVKIVSDGDVDFSKVCIDIFSQVESNTIGAKEYYETYSHSAYFSNNGEYRFVGESTNYSVSINFDTLPNNYGVVSKNIFITNDNPIAEFIIAEIDNIEINIDDVGIGTAKFFSFNGRELLADYKLKILYTKETIVQDSNKINYSANLQVSGRKYTINNSKDISNLSNDNKEKMFNKIIENKLETENYVVSNLNNVEDENDSEMPYVNSGRFKVSYTLSDNQIISDRTMILARQIANNMVEVENFFTNDLGFQRAADTNKNVPNIYNVILNICHDETVNKITSKVVQARTDNQDYEMIDETHFFYRSNITITLRYNFNNSDIVGSNFNEFLKEVCAHEYFHAIVNMKGINSALIHESLASFMGLYYCDKYLKVKNSLVKEANTNRILCYYDYGEGVVVDNSYIKSDLEFFPSTTRDLNYEYGAMLFNIFMYEKFGTLDFVKQLIDNFDLNNLYYTYEYVPTLYGTTLSILLEEYQIYRKFPNLYVTAIDSYYTKDWKMHIPENEKIESNVNKDSLQKYSAQYIMFTGKKLVANDSIYFTMVLNKSLSEKIAIYTVKKRDNLPPIVKKIIMSESRITIRVDAVDLKPNEEMIIIFMNLSNESIKNWISYDFTTQKNNSKYSMSLVAPEKELELNLSEYSSFVSLDVPYAGWYELELELNSSSQQLPKNTIELYDYNNNIVKKCKYIEDEARSKSGENRLFVYLDSTRDLSMNVNNPYRLRIGYMYSDISCVLKVKRIREQAPTFGGVLLTKNVSFNNLAGDEVNYVRTTIVGNLSITLNASNVNSTDTQRILIIKKLKTEAFIEYGEVKTLTSTNPTIQLSYNTGIYEDFIIVILNGKNDIDISVNYNIDVKHDFDIILDPSDRDPAYLGTEVRLNGGLNNDNTITKGFTRCAYLGTNAPTLSRLDYEWKSSNDNIATVSSYGTILAINPGIAVITAAKSSGESSCVVVEVIADENQNIVNFAISTDLGTEAGTGVGTYVKQGLGLPGGNDLIYGYTRIISLMDDAPSAILQNYNWTSSDPNIAYVSTYGTIIGRGVGIATITGVYKYNTRYVTSITIIVS